MDTSIVAKDLAADAESHRMRVLDARLMLAALVLVFSFLGGSAQAAGITVTPITWDVVGLDSNSPASGPNVFPVGARACNTSGGPLTNVVSTWEWDSANAYINLQNVPTDALGSMVAGACVDTYYNVLITQIAAAYDATRQHQIKLTSTEGSTGETPVGRQIYVEKLVSQNRNSTKAISGPGGCNLAYTVCDPPDVTLTVGQTYTYKVYGETASNYEQVEAFINFPDSIFRVNSASATYENPTGATGTSPYADACGWNPNPGTANYKKCVGPDNYTGGKVGGRVVVTYNVTIEHAAPGFLQSLFYDFSGSSFHYNSDFTDSSLGLAFESFWPLTVAVTGTGTVTSDIGAINCGATCEALYQDNDVVTLTAAPGAGQSFTGWGGACAGMTLTCAVTMDQIRDVTAGFAPITYYTLDASVVGSGSIASSPTGITCGLDCAEDYADGSAVTLTATPSVGQVFVGWTGCTPVVGFPDMCMVTMDQDRSVTAEFALAPPIIYPLTVSVTGLGDVTSSPLGVDCGVDCAEDYSDGTVVTLTATPAAGQQFTGWGGACSGTALTCDVTMSVARSVTATFAAIPTHQLDVVVTGIGTVTSSPVGVDCGGDCLETYSDGTVVTLTATPGAGQQFVGWNGDCSGSSTSCMVTMDQPRLVEASFQAIVFPLTVGVTGLGSVASSPTGIDCGVDCAQDYNQDIVVTLTATPVAGQQFTGWGGACLAYGTALACDVTMSVARDVTAAFAVIPPVTHTLDASVVGSGSIASSPTGITCGLDCAEDYADGSAVTLTATPSVGQVFVGWTGCTPVVGFPDMCMVTMDQDRSVTAEFALAPPIIYPLTVSVTGLGDVTSSPLGVDCGVDCAEDYSDGTVVTLTATADPGQEFVGWTGACFGTASTCDVTMDQARSVTATFQAIAPVTRTLTVSVTGLGDVTSSPLGVDCGVDCSEDYGDGTLVTLTAAPGPGQEFVGWGGACAGSASTCDVTMDQARSVSATFQAIVFPLTVSVAGSGSITSSPAGIDCGVDCAQDYNQDTVVTLTATPSAGQQFTGWVGACSGSATTCMVTMSQARSVTATFQAIPPVTHDVAATVVGSGTITSGPSGINCGSDCSETYAAGTVVTLTATPASGQQFLGWGGACSGTATTCDVTVNQAISVTATFQATMTTTPPTTTPPTTTPVSPPPTPPASAKAPTITLTLTPSVSTVPGGSVLTVKLDLRNLGPVDAIGVVVCAPIPDGFSLISAPGGKLSGGNVCWKVGTLVEGATPTLTMRLRAHGRVTPRRVVLKATADASNARKVSAKARRGRTRVVYITANRVVRRLSPTG